MNLMARFKNSNVTKVHSDLVPLHDIRTNTAIPGFPSTPGDINAMSSMQNQHSISGRAQNG